MFLVFFNFLPLERCRATFVAAGDWVLGALRMVIFNDIFEGSVVVTAVLTGKGSLHALFGLVGNKVATLEPLPTLVLTRNLHKLAPGQSIIWR
jgi:hypothetical protein